MFNIDFEAKRTKDFINFAKYGLTTLLVAGITVALVFAAGGYDIDRKTGEIIQNGLVIIASQPLSADVYVNGENKSDPTPSKFSLPASQYTFELIRDGYHTWSKKVSIEGSDVVWLQYPRLIPSNLSTQAVQAYKDVVLASQTPDRKYVLIHEANGGENFSLMSTEATQTEPQSVVLPEDILNAQDPKTSVFNVLDWAQDSKTVVLSHINGQVNEVIMFNVDNPSEAINLTQKYELALKNLRFVDNSNDRLYAIVGSSLRVVDVGAGNITAALIDNLHQYEPKDGLVVALHGKKGETKISLLENQSTVINYTSLQNEASTYLLATGIFDGERFIALADNTQQRVFIYKDILKTAKNQEGPSLFDSLRLDNTKFISFSLNGRFVLAQSGQDFRLYDFDVDEKKAFNVKKEITDKNQATWVDGYHINIIDDKQVTHFLDYDGLNSHELGTVDAQLGVFYQPSIEGLLYFKTDAKGSDILNFTSLIAQPS